MGGSISTLEANPAALAPFEGFAGRWTRRSVSVGAATLAFLALVLTAPILAPLAGLLDLLRGSRGARIRFLGVVLVYLGCELLGLAASFGLWVGTGFGRARAALLDHSFALQRWWVRSIFETSRRILGVQVHVEGIEAVSTGPVLLLLRHASLIDTLLPARLVSDRFGLRLRYVLKRDLLWDPCLDVVGQRLPNAFVRRGGEDTGGDLDAVRGIAKALGPQDGVALFPEGTRFSAQLRERLLKKLEDRGDVEAHVRARELQHVLPPRPGGALALLEAAPNVDVVFCAHRGFADVRSFGDILDGALVGRQVFVRFWRCPAATIPATTPERLRWLHEQWRRVDAVVGGDDDA